MSRTEAVDCILHIFRRRRVAAPAPVFSALPSDAQFFEILKPGRRGRDRLADLRPDRQRVRSRDGGTGSVSTHGAAGFRGRPRRGPLSAPACCAALPARPGADGAVSRLGRLFGLAHRIADICRNGRAWHGHRLRKPGGRRIAAADRSAGRAATRDRAVQRLRANRRDHRTRAGRPGLCHRSQRTIRHDGRVLAVGSGIERRDPSGATGRRQEFGDAGRFVRRRPVRPQQSRHSRHDLARSVRGAAGRSDCAAADLRAIFCRPAPGASASYAPRPLSARW